MTFWIKAFRRCRELESKSGESLTAESLALAELLVQALWEQKKKLPVNSFRVNNSWVEPFEPIPLFPQFPGYHRDWQGVAVVDYVPVPYDPRGEPWNKSAPTIYATRQLLSVRESTICMWKTEFVWPDEVEEWHNSVHHDDFESEREWPNKKELPERDYDWEYLQRVAALKVLDERTWPFDDRKRFIGITRTLQEWHGIDLPHTWYNVP